MGKGREEVARNKAFVRSVLTEDLSKWSRECILAYPTHFERSIDLLLEAAKAASRGKSGRHEAQSAIGQMDDQEMRDWFDKYAQNAGTVRLEILGRTPSELAGRGSIKRPTKKTETEIIRRDGFHCRYCGVRIVPNDQMKKLQDVVGYETLPNRSLARGRTRNTDVHGVWLLTRATVDHVDPVAGGSTDVNRPENLVASCWPCNYAKWKYTIDDLELDCPSTRPSKKSDWLGLTDFLA